MSEDKKQFDRIEDLLTQLIGNVASVRNDMAEFRAEVNNFRTEVNHRLNELGQHQQELTGQVALLNQRLDYQLHRIAKAEEEVHLLKERQ